MTMDCLITKLKGTVNDDSLRKINEFYFDVDNLSANKSITLSALTSGEARISGDGYFSDNIGGNKGKSLNLTEGDNTLYLPSGKSFRLFSPQDVYQIVAENANPANSIKIYTEQLKYTKLSTLSVQGITLVGDIANLPTTLANLYVNMVGNEDYLYGKLSSLPVLSNAKIIQLNYTSVTGNLTDLIKFPNATALNFTGTKITGDISALNSLTSLKTYNQQYVTGLSGDLSQLTYLTKFVCSSGSNTFSWSGTKSGDALVLQGVNLGNDVDKYLQNMVSLSDGSVKSITIYGEKTAGSDSAVSTLKERGYTISVNGSLL